MDYEVYKALSVKLRIAASPFQAICDSLLNLAATVCESQFAILSLKDTHSHLFVSTLGITGLEEVADVDSICSYAAANSLIEVEDAMVDVRFCNNPYVTGEPHIRSYAGVPVCLPTGEKLGTICVFDQSPRVLQSHQAKALMSISKVLFNTMVAQDIMFKQITQSESPL